MSDIKIYVSHRIDLQSELIDNPLYVPVRCGAVFDGENPSGLIGDDTGDNISHLRMSFCELTVQYWAWKNEKADYYGLCHYRRYLSFSEKQFKTDEYNMVFVPTMLPRDKMRYGLLDEAKMSQMIESHDGIVAPPAPVERIPTLSGRRNTVLAWWEAQDGIYFEKRFIPILLDTLDRLAPEYSEDARAYLSGREFWGNNCYVLNRELFDRLCRFVFPVLFAVDEIVNAQADTEKYPRTIGYLGEILYGVFVYRLCRQSDLRIARCQLVYFRNADKINGKWDVFKRFCGSGAQKIVRAAAAPLLPKGSAMRERIKRILN